MKTLPLVILILLSFQIAAQENEIIQWINNNAIKIEDANPNSELSIFNDNIPEKFTNAKIFGFGEASHHGKEFFDIKAKFFKNLVETQNVKAFIMEDSYPAEAGINEWISGGKGSKETIANNFNIPIWYCTEIVDLLLWMRNYNLDKNEDEQIRFYAMDIQNVKKINFEIRNLVEKLKIPVSQELLKVLDQCVSKEIDYGKTTNWADIQIPKLNEIESILLDFQIASENQNDALFDTTIRSLSYLKQYTYYAQYHNSQVRDLKMYENVRWIIENKTKNGKAFIWAHNEHINNKSAGHTNARKLFNLGRHLKKFYKDDYYSVGFDFGNGSLLGYYFDENDQINRRIYQLTEPFPKTYAKTLIKAKDDIYFIDMLEVLNSNSHKFFDKKAKQLGLGGPGYDPENYYLFNKRFSEIFDGLIFVKTISVPNYNLSLKE